MMLQLRNMIPVLIGALCIGTAALAADRAGGSRPQDHRVLPLESASGSLTFEQNTGWYDKRVRFVARPRGATVFLTDSEMVMVLPVTGNASRTYTDASQVGRRLPATMTPRPQRAGHVLRMRLTGANAKALATGLGRKPGVVNYLMGSDPTKWRCNIPTYDKAMLSGVYPGVDLVYYGREAGTGTPQSGHAQGGDRSGCLNRQGGRLEYDFVLHPDADPRRIRLAFDGADRVRVAQGDLVLSTPGGDVRMKRPIAYQIVNGRRRQVACAYRLQPSRADSFPTRVALSVGAYDESLPLVVDPVLEYSTYLGGQSYTSVVAVDGSGAAYLGGDTSVVAFPTTAGAYDTTYNGGQDLFITKLNASGSALIYSTFIGGTGTEHVGGIAVDTAGALYVAGYSDSSDFPTTDGAFDRTANGSDSDAIALKLNASGSGLVYSTYLGGSTGNVASGIAVDSAGSAYVAGITWSTDFPTTAGAFDRTYNGGYEDVFVTKLTPAGSALEYSTYLGGASDDYCYGVAVGASGAAYVVGDTSSSDYPTTDGAYDRTFNGGGRDAFVTKLSENGGALVYSTYLGGSGREVNTSLAVDGAGAVYLVGNTNSTDYPTTPGAYRATFAGGYYDVFVCKLNPSGSSLAYSTFLGGAQMDQGYGITVDASGSASVVGQTLSAAFPTTADALKTTMSGDSDGFVCALDPTGSAILYSTFIGGSGPDACFGVASDAVGALYVVGATGSSNFYTTPGSYVTSLGGSSDGFAMKLAFRSGTTLFALDRSGAITETVALRAYLRRSSDNAWLDGKEIAFQVDGTIVGSAITGAAGTLGRADLNWVITEGPASRSIVASFAGDTSYSPSWGSATLTAQYWSTKMVAFDRTVRITDRTELKCRLLRSDNVPLYGKPIQFYVDGTFVVTRNTDVDGYAKWPVYDVPEGAGAGARTIRSEWSGNAGYGATSRTATLTVRKAIPYIWVLSKSVLQGGVANLYAYFRRLYDYRKQEGKPVTFRIDGTWIADVTTGSGTIDPGVARRFHNTSGLSRGVHTVRCEFGGDAWLDAGYGEANLTIY